MSQKKIVGPETLKSEYRAAIEENMASEKPKAKVLDHLFEGDPDAWVVLAHASSKIEGWANTTKAMAIMNKGVLVKTTSQKRNEDGSYALAESLQYVPGVSIKEEMIGKSIIRKLG